MSGALKKCAELALALLYPRGARCAGCGSMAGNEGQWLCAQCRREMATHWIGTSDPPEGLDAAAFCYDYRGPAGGMVRALKYQGAWRMADAMAGDMTLAVEHLALSGLDGVTWVPMREKRLRERGFNHAEALGRAIAGMLSLPGDELLRRTRDVGQQAKRAREARESAMKGAFEAQVPLKGRRLLLVDDVCTTGATACACADALRSAGAEYVALVCYASALHENRKRRNQRRAAAKKNPKRETP